MALVVRRTYPRPSYVTLRYLIDALIDAERQLAAGPWDQWHEDVLIAYRDKARETLDRALNQLTFERIRQDSLLII